MSVTTELNKITAVNVHNTLRKHLLVDGYDMVFDVDKSHGSYLYDSKHDKQYVDFFTFYASNPIGFNHPSVANDEAFHKRLLKAAIVKPANPDIYTEEMAEFVDTFSRVGIPDYLPHMFLIDGGALAVENALKVAFDWKVRKNFEKGHIVEKGHQVIHFKQAFHGRSGYTMSLTNTVPDKTDYFPKFKWPRINNPKMHFPLTDESIVKTAKSEELAINQIHQAISENRDDIAAIILEPIQAEGGDNHFTISFLKKLRQIADDNEIMLIFDEVQSGYGLTGKFWAHQHFVNPDVIAFGKKAQICGILCSKRVDEVEDNVFHKSSRINSTWGGNLTDMVRATKFLEIIEAENLVEHAAITGNYLLSQIQKLSEDFEGIITNPRGRGLMCAFDMNSSKERNNFLDETYENGLMVLGCGDRSIRFRPALNITNKVIDEGFEIIRTTLKKTY